jgi:hypothetical protein
MFYTNNDYYNLARLILSRNFIEICFRENSTCMNVHFNYMSNTLVISALCYLIRYNFTSSEENVKASSRYLRCDYTHYTNAVVPFHMGRRYVSIFGKIW